MESRNTKFLENDLISGSDQSQNIVSVRDQPSTSSDRLFSIHNTPQAQMGVEQPIIEVPQSADNILVDQVVQEMLEIIEQSVEQHDPQENVDSTLRRSTRERKLAIPRDYGVYLQESDNDIGTENDYETFLQPISCK